MPIEIKHYFLGLPVWVGKNGVDKLHPIQGNTGRAARIENNNELGYYECRPGESPKRAVLLNVHTRIGINMAGICLDLGLLNIFSRFYRQQITWRDSR